MAVKLALTSVTFPVRASRAGLPLRHRTVRLTHFPLLHLAVGADGGDEHRARGFAAEYLPPEWFDKDDSLETTT